MSIKCGRCKDRHETVAEVRDCYNGGQPASTPSLPTSQRATAPQVKYLNGLLRQFHCELATEKAADEMPYTEFRPLLDGMIAYRDKRTTSLPAGIVRDEAHQSADGDPEGYGDPQPQRPGIFPNLADVPAGHYAVPSLTGNNDLDFFRVDRPTEGRWAGRTFVKRVIGGKPDTPVRGSTARNALEAILNADPAKAAQRYGQEIGRCWKCNRHLTDETSRSLGIGPDCRSK